MGAYIFVLLIALVICLAVILNLYVSNKDRNAKTKVYVEQLAKENEELKEKLQQTVKDLAELKTAAKAIRDLQKDIKSRIPDFLSVPSLGEKLKLMENFWTGYYNGEQFFKDHSPKSDEFFRDLYRRLKASDTIEELQEKVTTPFYEAMDQEQLDAVGVREKLLKMAMQMYDVISAFRSANQRKKDQGLNIGIVKGEKTEEEALEEAKVITDFEAETPRWIRSMALGIRGIGVEDKGIILSGYKLASQKEDLIAETTNEEVPVTETSKDEE